MPKLTTAFAEVQRMEASQFCTFIIHTDGKVTACGKGSYGRLELGESSSSSAVDASSVGGTQPRAVDIPGPVKMICSSGGSDGFALALTEDGSVYSWGDGDYGKLGHGNTFTYKKPQRIKGELEGKNVVIISAGYRHSGAVTEDGVLYTWGEGDFGRLGHGDSQSRDVPTMVKDIGPVSQIACGAAHTLALSEDGRTVWSFGSGDHGKLGHGDLARVYRPKMVDSLQGLTLSKIQVGSHMSMALTNDGSIYVWGTGSMLGLGSNEATVLLPRIIDDLADVRIVDVSAGDNHCLALSQDCSVYAWGVNKVGQCGLGHTGVCHSPQKVKALEGVHIHQVSAGTSHSAAWTALPKDRHFVMWHTPFCADLRSDTYATLCDLLGNFGTEWTRPSAPEPFASRLEQQDFVSCVLRLLCCHVTLANTSRSGNVVGGSAGNLLGRREDELRESERRRLEKILYSLVDLQCPADVLDLIHACLNKGANLLLPNFEIRMGQLAALLQAKDLTNGQELNLRLLLQSLDDPAVVAELLTLPAADCSTKDEATASAEAEVKAFAVLKTLIVRTFRHFVSRQ